MNRQTHRDTLLNLTVKMLMLSSALFIQVLLFNQGLLAYKQANAHSTSKFDVYKTCQEIAATRTNETWHYTDCIKELQGALQPSAIIQKT